MEASKQIFHNVPNTVVVKMIRTDQKLPPDETWKESFLQDPVTAEVVQVALSRGPFVAFAKVGPEFYVGEPTEFKHQIPNHRDLPVYGWTSKEKRKSEEAVHGIYEAVIVCGVRKREDNEHLFYVRARETRTDWREGIGKYDALTTDQRVYVSSVRRFSDTLHIMYPPASDAEIVRSAQSAERRHRELEDKCADLETLIMKSR